MLEEISARDRGQAAAERLWEIAKQIRRSPGDPAAAEMIRQMRDERSDEIWRRVSGGEE